MAWTKEQQLAIDEDGQNIIVSAGAGSGKTAVLTARTMRILNSGVHVNELLILTFTKAAAGEMKERIRKSIKKGLATNPQLQHELELIDQAYITTFDSFALSVVKKYHYLLNISNNISISESSIIEMQKTKIMDEVFEKNYANPTSDFTNLINDFCIKDDQDIRNSVLKIASKIDGFPNREEYLENYETQYLSDNFIIECLNEYEKLLKNEISEIHKQAENFYLLMDGEYETRCEKELANLYNAQSIDEIYNALLSIKIPSLPRGSEDEQKEAKENLKKALSNLSDIALNYGNTQTIKENISKTFTYSRSIIAIIKEFLKQLHEYKALNEIYDFQDIALLSIKILKENYQVREELKNTFKQIMIDEYQDTNDIQETFISMIENNNVYMVGDIKQSIYRFRNANPYIFKNKYDNYAQHLNGLKIDLVKNFRSRMEVLANINEIFNLVMDNVIGGAEYHESHQMVYGNTTYIEEGKTDQNYNCQILEYELNKESPYTKEEIEIFTIAKDIQEKINNHYQVFDKDEKVLKDITYNDFVILMDRTTDFNLYKKIFEYMGIPLTLYKDEKLNNSDDIYILKNIIDFIVKINLQEFDNSFKYDFVSIARSYLYNLSDQEIFTCFKNNDFFHNQVYNDLKELSDQLSFSTISNLVYLIVKKTKMYEKLLQISNIEASITRIDKLLDIASNLAILGYNIYTFRDYLNELIEKNYDMKYSVLGSNSNSVKIMTIHKSKGLEYHICYYSGLYKSFNISDLKERFLIDNTYGIITPFYHEGINESMLKYLVKYHYLEEEVSEKIRLFYVALTRSKEQMIMITPKVDEKSYLLEENNTIELGVRRKYRSFSDILNSIKDKIVKYYETIDLTKLNITNEYLFNNKKLPEIPDNEVETFEVTELTLPETTEIEKEHFSKKLNELIDKKTANNLEFGLEFHESLELIDFKNPDYTLIDNSFVVNKIKKFLTNQLLTNIQEATIYKEYEFIYIKKDTEYHGIIDLMLEYKDRIDIIDYKLSNIKDENYLKQLNGYKNYIEKISNKKTNIYLYSIMNETVEKL